MYCRVWRSQARQRQPGTRGRGSSRIRKSQRSITCRHRIGSSLETTCRPYTTVDEDEDDNEEEEEEEDENEEDEDEEEK